MAHIDLEIQPNVECFYGTCKAQVQSLVHKFATFWLLISALFWSIIIGHIDFLAIVGQNIMMGKARDETSHLMVAT